MKARGQRAFSACGCLNVVGHDSTGRSDSRSGLYGVVAGVVVRERLGFFLLLVLLRRQSTNSETAGGGVLNQNAHGLGPGESQLALTKSAQIFKSCILSDAGQQATATAEGSFFRLSLTCPWLKISLCTRGESRAMPAIVEATRKYHTAFHPPKFCSGPMTRRPGTQTGHTCKQ